MVTIENYDELIEIIAKYAGSDKYVYRGQVRNYSTNKYPYSFQTSFEREKCNPNIRTRWQYYCYNAMKMVLGSEKYRQCSYDEMLDYVEALFQHYGWQSWYIDFSKDIAVSLFFAGFMYKSQYEYHLIEDYQEEFVIEQVNNANYYESNLEYGYLYILDKSILLNDTTVKFIDLTNSIFDANCRPVRQSGCLVSTYPTTNNELLNASISIVIRINTKIIIEYCGKNGINQKTLFPNNEEDYVYDFLLSLPRKEFIDKEGKQTDFFLKQFRIPEYNVNFQKLKAPSVAYFSSFWILENLKNFGYASEEDKRNSPFGDCVYYKCINDGFYHWFSKEGDYLQMPEFIGLVRKQKNVVLEFDNIYRHYTGKKTEYQKGIQYRLNSDLIEVTEIVIDWAGKSVLGFGALSSRYYKIINDIEVAIVRVEKDCPCDDDDRHLHKLLVGKYFAQMISEGYLHPQKIRDMEYLIKD